MDLFEYQARDLFAAHGVPVLDADVATTPDEARAAAEKLGGGTVVVKAQVKTAAGGRPAGSSWPAARRRPRSAPARSSGWTSRATRCTA